MFQAFSKGIFTHNKCSAVSLKFPRFKTTFKVQQWPKDMLNVKLTGTIPSEPLVFEDGNKLIYINTALPNGHYTINRAIITSPEILKMVGNSLRDGKRVHVSGSLEVSTYKNNNDKFRQEFQIRVNELYASKMNKSKDLVDVNIVFCLAYIASDITYFDNGVAFRICTHYIPKMAADGESDNIVFVRIYDENLIPLVKENLQRGDKIFLDGVLCSKLNIDQSGRKKYCGFIEATNILKVD